MAKQFKIKNLLYASSSSVYGNNSKMPFTETEDTSLPESLYAATKKSNELMACSYSKLYKFNTIGLRFFTVYGPWGRPDMSPFLFTEAILLNKKINLFNYGIMERDFTYIDDIIEGIISINNYYLNTYVENSYEIYKLQPGKNEFEGNSFFLETLVEEYKDEKSKKCYEFTYSVIGQSKKLLTKKEIKE